jgi:hypothetical protein
MNGDPSTLAPLERFDPLISGHVSRSQNFILQRLTMR